jgi:hypothetical protein
MKNSNSVAGVVLDEARGATVHAVARAGDVDTIASDPLDVVAQDLVVVAADVDPMSTGALIAGDIGVVEVNIVVPDDVGAAGHFNAVARQKQGHHPHPSHEWCCSRYSPQQRRLLP